MSTPTFTIPETEKNMLDDIIFEQEHANELPRRTGFSGLMRQLAREYIDEHQDKLETSARYEEYRTYLEDADHFQIPASDRRAPVAVPTSE